MLAKDCAGRLLSEFNIDVTPDSLRLLLTEFDDEYEIERRNAASIIHIFIRDVLNIPDISDPKRLAECDKLKDLYDCRVCVNAIMQVYLRKLMVPLYKLSDTSLMFGGKDKFCNDELTHVIININKMINKP